MVWPFDGCWLALKRVALGLLLPAKIDLVPVFLYFPKISIVILDLFLNIKSYCSIYL